MRSASLSTQLVSHVPPAYPHQVGLTCGEQNVRAIVEGFGRRYVRPSPVPLRVRLVGYSFVRDIWALLDANGLRSSIRHASHLGPEELLRTIGQHIRRDEPVIVAIGNGHLSRDRDSALARRLLGHYITVYGVDHERQRFYVYDAYLSGPPPEPLPAGNETRGFDEFLRDWDGPFYYRYIGMDHVYLPVHVERPTA